MQIPFRTLFEMPETIAAIADLADATDVTVIAGAGISMEAGLPSWNSLVHQLLKDAADNMGVPDDEQDRLVDELISPATPDGDAGLAHAWIGDALEERVIAALFGDRDPATVSPGPAARAIADLVTALGPRNCDLATTNYDRLLRKALLDSGVPASQIVEVRKSTGVGAGKYAVRHLHGVVQGRRKIPGLVLTDQQYAATQEQYRWQHQYVIARLRSSVTLFVGMSMTDRNILRYLHRSGTAPTPHTHYALLLDRGIEEKEDVAEWRATAASRRWDQLGITPLRATCPAEVSQFLQEVALAKSRGSGYMPFLDRCSDLQAVADKLCGNGENERLSAIQDDVQIYLASLLDIIRTMVAADERLALHVWIYEPDKDGLTLWGQSDRTWRDYTTLDVTPLAPHTRWVGVDTFQVGALVSDQVHPDRGSRWNFVLSIPMHFQHSGGELPLGVVSLASMTSESEVDAMEASEQAELMEAIANAVEDFIGDIVDEPVKTV